MPGSTYLSIYRVHYLYCIYFMGGAQGLDLPENLVP